MSIPGKKPHPEHTDAEIQQRFMAYLNQRGGISLEQFCTALGFYKIGYGRKDRTKRFAPALLSRIDGLCTAMLPDPRCRIEEPKLSANGSDTTSMAVRYVLHPPREKFVPADHESGLRVRRDPALATWTPKVAVQPSWRSGTARRLSMASTRCRRSLCCGGIYRRYREKRRGCLCRQGAPRWKT